MKSVLIMKTFLTLAILTCGLTANALEYHTIQFQHVYGSGWEAEGAWVVPMTESAADGIIIAQKLEKNKVTCSVKSVVKGSTADTNVLEFLAYDIKNCY
jgi:hypothetical protein